MKGVYFVRFFDATINRWRLIEQFARETVALDCAQQRAEIYHAPHRVEENNKIIAIFNERGIKE